MNKTKEETIREVESELIDIADYIDITAECVDQIRNKLKDL